jgi:hypothetical protein
VIDHHNRDEVLTCNSEEDFKNISHESKKARRI